MLNGSPIVVVATIRSANDGTGDIPQIAIMPDPRTMGGGFQPMRTSGADAAVCGDCKYRTAMDGGCYVAPMGVASIWNGVRSGAITYATAPFVAALYARARRMRAIRIGSYGDPVAAPLTVWTTIRDSIGSARMIGYTHQWRLPIAAAFRDLYMASVDSPAERDAARAMGWRTYRARTADQPLDDCERVCPKSAEAGAMATCSQCRGCDGAARSADLRGYAVIVHGSAAGRASEAVRRASMGAMVRAGQ